MRIAFITSWLSQRGGGIACSLIPLSRELSKTAGIDVELIGFDAPEVQPARRVIVCQPMRPAMFPISFGMTSALFETTFDIVHTHGLWSFASIAAQKWRSRTQRPLIVSPHGMLDSWAMQNSIWKKRLALLAFERTHLRSADVIHALNESEANAIRALGLRSPIAVIPNGVDVHPKSLSLPRPHFLGDDDRRVLLFLGRIHPKKGIDALIKAWQHVTKERPDLKQEWQLVIAGWDDGQYLPKMNRLVSDLALEGHVRIVGPVFGQEKLRTFQHAHAFILPSQSEGLPMTVLEAWACSLPIFMTAKCHVPEGFRAGAGFPIGTEPEEIARPLIELLPQPRLLERAGEAGLELAQSTFSWARVSRDWNDVHRWLLSGGTGPRCLH